MDHITIKLDASEYESIKSIIQETIRSEAKAIVLETLAQQQENITNYTTEEAALKLHCSIPTLRKWRMEGKIVGAKVGASYVYSLQSINEALELGIKHKRWTY